MVTVTPHLRNAIGVMVVSEDVKKGLFTALVEKETAVPCRRAGVFAVPREGGDVIVKICEGVRDIKVSKKEKPRTNGKGVADDSNSEVDEDDEVRCFGLMSLLIPHSRKYSMIKTGADFRHRHRMKRSAKKLGMSEPFSPKPQFRR